MAAIATKLGSAALPGLANLAGSSKLLAVGLNNKVTDGIGNYINLEYKKEKYKKGRKRLRKSRKEVWKQEKKDQKLIKRNKNLENRIKKQEKDI